MSLLRVLIQKIDPGPRWVFAIDDSPTKRYGQRVQGTGYHHNPTSGPTNQKYLFGHVFVTMAWIVKTPWNKALALPLLSKLYIKAKDVANLATDSLEWTFRTKLELAGELLGWIAKWLTLSGKDLWVVFDGAYNKSPLLSKARQLGITVVSRLAKNAALYSVPDPVTQAGQGRPRKYGKMRLTLAAEGAKNRMPACRAF